MLKYFLLFTLALILVLQAYTQNEKHTNLRFVDSIDIGKLLHLSNLELSTGGLLTGSNFDTLVFTNSQKIIKYENGKIIEYNFRTKYPAQVRAAAIVGPYILLFDYANQKIIKYDLQKQRTKIISLITQKDDVLYDIWTSSFNLVYNKTNNEILFNVAPNLKNGAFSEEYYSNFNIMGRFNVGKNNVKLKTVDIKRDSIYMKKSFLSYLNYAAFSMDTLYKRIFISEFATYKIKILDINTGLVSTMGERGLYDIGQELIPISMKTNTSRRNAIYSIRSTKYGNTYFDLKTNYLFRLYTPGRECQINEDSLSITLPLINGLCQKDMYIAGIENKLSPIKHYVQVYDMNMDNRLIMDININNKQSIIRMEYPFIYFAGRTNQTLYLYKAKIEKL